MLKYVHREMRGMAVCRAAKTFGGRLLFYTSSPLSVPLCRIRCMPGTGFYALKEMGIGMFSVWKQLANLTTGARGSAHGEAVGNKGMGANNGLNTQTRRRQGDRTHGTDVGV